MSYKALYRKYRPSSFEDVCGQQHVVATLQNAIKNDKLAHAYLFCGPRGTGKTSIAKLLAKTINCTSDGKRPCGECENCRNIQESNHPDVVELDGATNNGVDEIRNLIESVKYTPMQGKYKVYIIDEVHMITPNAFNALLKTLEEPPEYCIFILCTTEPHKVLPTIVSRCQRFDFNKGTVWAIKGRLQYVCQQEKITCEDGALQLIAELADGGFRDALSILDQCIAFAQDNITVQDVSAVYGVASLKEKMELFSSIKEKDAEKMIALVTDFTNRGLDISRLNTDLINMAKEAVVYAYTKKEDLLDKLGKQQAEVLIDQFTTGELLQYVDYLMDTASKFKDATDATAYFEVGLLKMMDYKPQPVQQEVISNVSETVASPVVTKAPEKPKIISKPSKKLSDDDFLKILKASNKQLKLDDADKWRQVVNSQEEKYQPVVSMLQESLVMAESEKELIVIVDDRIFVENLNQLDNLATLEELVEKCYGCHKDVVFVTNQTSQYITDYFRKHRYDEVVSEPIEEKKPETTVEDKLTSLFGKEGYMVTGEK